jgi:hypothetical protein
MKTMLAAHSDVSGTNYETTGILYTLRNLKRIRVERLAPDVQLRLLQNADSIVEFYDKVVDVIAPDTERFIDKSSPRPFIFKMLLHRFPNARFIVTIRDPRDCYCSAKKHEHVYQATDKIGAYVDYWAKMATSMKKLVSHKNVYLIRYEDLTENPEDSIRRLDGFLNLKYEEGQIDHRGFSSATDLAKSKNHQNLSKDISTRSVDRWRQELSAEESGCFRKLGPLLSHFGYESDV